MTNSIKSQKSNENIGNDLPVGISQPAIRALAAAEITNLEQFTKISKDELVKLHGVGPKAIRMISEALEEKGLQFAHSDQSDRVSEHTNKKIQRRI
jgi:DNA uptake protein ComE-like DNA-binding protein